MTDLATIVATARSEFAACSMPPRSKNAKARYLGKAGALTDLLKGLGKLSGRGTAGCRRRDQRGEAGYSRSALTARRAALADAKLAQQLAADALDVTLPGRGARHGHAASAVARAWSASRRCSARSASRSPTARRSRTTSTTSPRSTRRRTTLPARCRTRSTSRAAWCCARTRRRSRCATWKRTRRRSRSSRRVASIASTATPRTRRCSTRSRACGSTATSRSPT